MQKIQTINSQFYYLSTRSEAIEMKQFQIIISKLPSNYIRTVYNELRDKIWNSQTPQPNRGSPTGYLQALACLKTS